MGQDKSEWDVFISHANEDKENFVEPLVQALAVLGAKVWYDRFSLSVGDSLSRSIDNGLSRSRYGIVILSAAFFAKQWPDYELRGLIAKEIQFGKTILPVWHNVTREDVLRYSPSLADKVALSSLNKNPLELAVELLSTIRPDLFEKLHQRIAYQEAIKRGENKTVTPEELATFKVGPIRHDRFSASFIARIRLIRAAIWEVYPHSMKFWLDGFKRDFSPNKEIMWWEHIASCYLEYVTIEDVRPEYRNDVLSVFFAIANEIGSEGMEKHLEALPEDAYDKMKTIYQYSLPIFDIDDEFPHDYIGEYPNTGI